MSARFTATHRWFFASAASWTLATSMSQTVLSWLMVGELRERATWVGAAQMCQQLPYLVFLLFGGLVADRLELRGLMRRLHVLAALTAAALAVLAAGGHVGLEVLLPYALVWGTIQAFSSPARDALISHVFTGDLLRAITAVTLVQFLALAIGARLGGLVGQLGSAATLALQAAISLSGLVALRQLPDAPPPERPAGERVGGVLAGLRSGLREVARSRELLPIALLVAANGLLFMGPFQVIGPLLVREVYRGGASEIALLWMALPLGSIAGSLAMLARGGVRRKGPAFLAALAGVSCCLFAFAAEPPFWIFLGVIFVWGVFHSVFFNTSRALFQGLASGVHRGRILSIHSLGLLGMAPISNLGAGFLADAVGAHTSCILAGGAMLVAVAVAAATTAVRKLA